MTKVTTKERKGFALNGLNLAILAVFTSGIANAQQATDTKATTATLDEVVVKGKSAAASAQVVLTEIPGSASVVSSEELARGRNTTLGDVLAYQPGVFVQSVGGNDAVKISIRGSGNFKDSHDLTLSIGNDLEISQGLWFTSGLAAVHVRRHVVITDTAANRNPQSTDYQNLSFAPRLGLRFHLAPELQVFGNYTRSIDPPLDWRYASTTTGLIAPLHEQRADTFEAGIKGQAGVFSGSLAVFRTDVQGDLLTVVDEAETARQGITVTRTFNSDTPTRRQGVELALDARLWKGGSGDQVLLRQSYTWNDFRYVNEPRLGNNRLPGIPEQVYQAKLQYEHAGGFYSNLNVQAASSTSIDYADTAFAPGYAVWGTTAGYESPKKDWKAYVDLKNLANRSYVATAGSVYDAKGAQAATRTYLPGDGFGIFVGGEFKF